jgi:hypothetical protein
VPLVVTGLGHGPQPNTIIIMSVVAAAIAAGGAALAAHGGRLRPIASGLARGCTALGDPVRFARTVTPWQLTSRVLRAASLACFLMAFGLPATPVAIVLVMVAQGGGRLLPFAPAGAAAGVAILAAGFSRATGSPAGLETLAAFLVGMSLLLTITGVVLAAAIALRMAGPRGLRAALRARPI